ncbi:MAG: 2Fe-2S iron-sulfur cluster binding domain-containing protein [Frankiaceae bacterium]|nr:2Fe-2S iron-sulfur cluster binding domain-containing protein [Frankiaceae bacterium]
MARTFHPLRVAEIRKETADTVSIALDVPAELADAYRFTPGQFLTFRVDGPGGRVDRSYSICSTPRDGELRVLVKRLEGGVFGEHAHTSLAVGDELATSEPQGRFTVPLDPAHEKAYLAIAAGSGISPVYSVVRSILDGEPRSRVTLLYGNRGPSTVIFRDRLADLKDQWLDRFQLVHVFSREPQEAAALNGRLTTDKVRKLGEQLIDLSSYDDAFVCGPEPMTLEVRQALIDLGIPPRHVHVELYGSHTPKPVRNDPGGADEVRLDVTVGGIRRMVVGGPGETILDAARAAGLDVPFSCTGGVCATCRAKVVTGTCAMAVNYSLEPWELEAGFVLTCQASPTSPAITVDYDAV